MKQLIKSLLGIAPSSKNKARLPMVDLAVAVGEFKPGIKILAPETANGNITIHELISLNFMIAARSPATLFEIGTFDGRTTLNLAANSPENARIYTLDLPAAGLQNTKFALEEYDKGYVDKPQSGDRFKNRSEGAKILQLWGDSAQFDFSPYFNSVDFIFVDGAHAYEYVMNDSYIALKLLRNRKGTIAWHDYDNDCWPGVVRALDELSAGVPDFKNIKRIKDTNLAYLQFS